ncbi:2-oxoacid:acceptor oxidoreductase family protein [Candidatus Bathyarchaeota archaeon]|nr:2-oxoacid:acceptor oxidoreductase family protein [Candidatus Bathyarchaeota archaeon]
MAKTGEKPLYEDIVMAGFGGQGLMFIGKLLAFSAMKEGRHVTWIPSYGPEMRGGTANCTIVISSEEIGSPVTAHPHTVLVMNNPSMETFEPRLKSGGLLLLSSSLVTHPVTRKDIKTLAIPASEVATSAGTEKSANMVMLGAYVALTKTVAKESIIEGLKELFGKKIDLFQTNVRAFEEGMRFADQQCAQPASDIAHQ